MKIGTFIIMEEYLAELVKEVKEKLKKIDIPVSGDIEKVVINKRAKKRLGACKKVIKPGNRAVFVIEISSILLNCKDDEICSVIAHELIHTCKDCFNHGKKWKEYAGRANSAYAYNIKRLANLENIKYENDSKMEYIVKCKNCGTVYKRVRMCPLIKNPERYRCGKCGVPLG